MRSYKTKSVILTVPVIILIMFIIVTVDFKQNGRQSEETNTAFSATVKYVVVNETEESIYPQIHNKSFNMKEAAGSTVMGALSGGLGGNGSNYKNVLTDTINGTKKVIAREMRRENKKYANKVIKSAVASKNNTLALAFWSGSASFTLGCGISNRVSCLFSRWFK